MDSTALWTASVDSSKSLTLSLASEQGAHRGETQAGDNASASFEIFDVRNISTGNASEVVGWDDRRQT